MSTYEDVKTSYPLNISLSDKTFLSVEFSPPFNFTCNNLTYRITAKKFNEWMNNAKSVCITLRLRANFQLIGRTTGSTHYEGSSHSEMNRAIVSVHTVL